MAKAKAEGNRQARRAAEAEQRRLVKRYLVDAPEKLFFPVAALVALYTIDEAGVAEEVTAGRLIPEFGPNDIVCFRGDLVKAWAQDRRAAGKMDYRRGSDRQIATFAREPAPPPEKFPAIGMGNLRVCVTGFPEGHTARPEEAIRIFKEEPERLLFPLGAIMAIFKISEEALLAELRSGRLVACGRPEGDGYTDIYVTGMELKKWVARRSIH